MQKNIYMYAKKVENNIPKKHTKKAQMQKNVGGCITYMASVIINYFIS